MAVQRKLLGGCLGAGLLAVLGVALLAAAIFYYARSKLAQTVPPPGEARRFDPVASYEPVAAFAGDGARLSSIAARFVRSDGTLDLEADYRPSPNVQYRFVREIAVPENAPPIGAGNAADGRWYEQVQVEISRPWEFRSVRRIGGPGGGASYQYFNRGMQRSAEASGSHTRAPAAPAPVCPFRRLWVEAIARGAPEAAVANIKYDARGYEFRIDALKFTMRFDPSCGVVSAPR